MDIIRNLYEYTEYARGDLSHKCSLAYEDIEITGLDFSQYDLNNSDFIGVLFEKCDFSNVYLSGSNFGGSIFDDCILMGNINKKSSWDDMTIGKTSITSMDAFRTSFTYGTFENVVFSKCSIEKCSFSYSCLKNVRFVECMIRDTDFEGCTFDNVVFEHSKLAGISFSKEDANDSCILPQGVSMK